jgi:HEAT repeat protein
MAPGVQEDLMAAATPEDDAARPVDALQELLRLAGARRLEEMPLDLEARIQDHLRSAGAAIVPHLALGLESASVRTRMKVATYLGQVGVPACEPPLLRGLRDEDPRVRMLAAISLRDCNQLTSVGPLLDLLMDPDPRVRGAAADAIAAITNHAHTYNPFDPPEARQAEQARLRTWVEAHAGWSRERIVAEGFQQAGYPMERVADSPAVLIEALGARTPCIRRNAEQELARLTGVRRTLAEELEEVDEGAAPPDYETTRREALRRLQRFYRRRIEPPR